MAHTYSVSTVIKASSTVWDNCTKYEREELDKIQNEAARIATGTTKLISEKALYKETKWETLAERRRKHKLVLFYKMINGLSPPYLSSLVPPSVNRASSYNLRNANDIRTVPARTKLYYDSFLPSVIREWNNLPLATRQSDSLNSFKRSLNNRDRFVPKHYYSGNRKLQTLHTRLRTGCSSLNHICLTRESQKRLFVDVVESKPLLIISYLVSCTKTNALLSTL